MTTTIEITNALLEECFEAHVTSAFNEFKQITRRHALFHILFFSIACLELLAFVLFFSFLTQSTILAFSLAGIFLTGFTYFILLFYLQAKKPEQLLSIRKSFIEKCHSSLPFEKREREYHLSLSQALHQFVTVLHRQEYTYYPLPSSFQTLAPLMQKFSVWSHWKDLHQMKEILIMMMIKENIELVKITPTDLETHATLASTYVSLSKLYQDPRKTHPEEEHLWIPPDYSSSIMVEKFKKAAWRAVEEFQIVDTYAPNELWVHVQLASLYHDLGMAEEEIREYEKILTIAPHERDVLFHLGVLYFAQGHNAQGLRLYEQLKQANDKRTEELLAFYDV
jgi:tetratricopeptide (TPR) repeat protein